MSGPSVRPVVGLPVGLVLIALNVVLAALVRNSTPVPRPWWAWALLGVVGTLGPLGGIFIGLSLRRLWRRGQIAVLVVVAVLLVVVICGADLIFSAMASNTPATIPR